MKDNFEELKKMVYSGRGLVVGMTPDGSPFIGSSLTGRRPSSQAREYVRGEGDVIKTNPTDPKILEEGSPALLIYPALVRCGDRLIGSNGAQTDLLLSAAENFPHPQVILSVAFRNPVNVYDEKGDREIDLTAPEPDDYNTPRINAVVGDENAALSTIFKGEEGSIHNKAYPIKLEPGRARVITTYQGDNAEPLKPFIESPLEASIVSLDSEGIVESVYEAIHGGQKEGDNYRVAAAVMMLKDGELETSILNRSERGN
tara:strand:+ start:6079 stop:6852 length:774 start_codon:yes stop_codon:yes gene_type:complete